LMGCLCQSRRMMAAHFRMKIALVASVAKK
jgi:hypothetical protein